jgi:enamine deaminase RidA (YjgF/YER057c/UK114 family)
VISVRQVVHSGGFEEVGGYSRAVRDGALICVSGTAPTGPDGSAISSDIYEQTHHAFSVALRAVEELGGTVEGVMRTRIFLAPDTDWRRSVDAHHDLFAAVTPANTTLFVAGFIPPGVLVEVEVDAMVTDGTAAEPPDMSQPPR